MIAASPTAVRGADAPTDRERTREEMVTEVGKSWQRPIAVEENSNSVRTDASVGLMAQRLGRIVLPTVSFSRVPLPQVIAALAAAAEECAHDGDDEPRINIVLLDPAGRAPEVTLSLRDVSLKRVLDFVADAVGYEYEIQSDAVVFRPESETPILETEFFPVGRATVLRMSGRTGEPTKASTRRSGANAVTAEVDTGLGEVETNAIKRFLQLAGVNFDHVAGASLAYDGSAMIVTQTKANLERIRTILSRYRAVRQVEIEAKFMEVREGALEELGLNWRAITAPTLPMLARRRRTRAATDRCPMHSRVVRAVSRAESFGPRRRRSLRMARSSPHPSSTFPS